MGWRWTAVVVCEVEAELLKSRRGSQRRGDHRLILDHSLPFSALHNPPPMNGRRRIQPHPSISYTLALTLQRVIHMPHALARPLRFPQSAPVLEGPPSPSSHVQKSVHRSALLSLSPLPRTLQSPQYSPIFSRLSDLSLTLI